MFSPLAYRSNCYTTGWNFLTEMSKKKREIPLVKRVEILAESDCQDEWLQDAWIDRKICVRAIGNSSIPCPVTN